MAELDARVRAVLRGPGSISSGILSCGEAAFRRAPGTPRSEGGRCPYRAGSMLLEELLRQSPRVVIKELLEERLYNYQQVTPNAVEWSLPACAGKLL